MKPTKPTLEIDYFDSAANELEQNQTDATSGVPLASSRLAQGLEWPDGIPVLTARDVCGSAETATEKRHPLWWWKTQTFGTSSPQSEIVTNEMFCAQTEEMGVRPFARSLVMLALKFSDADLADLWNRTMVRLGYDAPVVPRDAEESQVPAAEPGRKRRSRKK